MSFGKRGVVQQIAPIINPVERHGEGRTPRWLLSLAFGSGIALVSLVLFWSAYGLGYAAKAAIVLFCTFTAMFAVGEINVRAIARTLRLAFKGNVRGLLKGILFIVFGNVAIGAALYFGYVLSALAHLQRFSGTVEGHDVARAIFFSLPVILICMGMLLVLDRLLSDSSPHANSSFAGTPQ